MSMRPGQRVSQVPHRPHPPPQSRSPPGSGQRHRRGNRHELIRCGSSGVSALAREPAVSGRVCGRSGNDMDVTFMSPGRHECHIHVAGCGGCRGAGRADGVRGAGGAGGV